MLQIDAAVTQTERHDKREAQLRAGEVAPAGLGVRCCNRVGLDVDALDILFDKAVIAAQRHHRLDRRLQVAATGIGLEVTIDHAERRIGRELEVRRHAIRVPGKRLEESVRPFEHVGRPLDAAARQKRRGQAFARRMTRVQPLDVTAAGEKREQSRGCTGRKAERIRCLRTRKIEQACRRERRAERTDNAGGMETALPRHRMAGARDGGDGLIAGDHRFQQPLARNLFAISGR